MDAERKEMILKIEDISKKFGKTTVLRGISMEVKKGEIMGVRKIHAAWRDRGNAGARWREDHDERKGDLRGVQCSGTGETPYEYGVPEF